VPHENESVDPIGDLFTGLEGSRPGLDELGDAAVSIRDRPWELRQSLEALLGDEEELAQVAKRSAFHANGFAKVVLHLGVDCGVRLHVWSPRHRPGSTPPNPHGHRWEFASWVVTGALREVRYTEAPAGKLFELRDYGRNPDGSIFCRPNGSVTLAPVELVDRRVGEVYRCGRSVLHTAEPVGGLAASLVLQGQRSIGATGVYRRPGRPKNGQEPQLSPDELRLLLDDVVATIR
jgi:hypothetical protein